MNGSGWLRVVFYDVELDLGSSLKTNWKGKKHVGVTYHSRSFYVHVSLSAHRREMILRMAYVYR